MLLSLLTPEARIVACCAAALISACSSGRLDTFEVVRTAGGQAGAQSAGGGAGGGGNTAQPGGGGTGGRRSLLIDDFEDQDLSGPRWVGEYAIDDETGPTASSPSTP